MSRAVFYVELGGKLRKRTLVIEDKLAVLSDIIDTLMEHNIEDDNDDDCPFSVCYNYLADKCTKIGTKAFRLDKNKYWAEFLQLTEKEVDEEICFAVSLIEV